MNRDTTHRLSYRLNRSTQIFIFLQPALQPVCLIRYLSHYFLFDSKALFHYVCNVCVLGTVVALPVRNNLYRRFVYNEQLPAMIRSGSSCSWSIRAIKLVVRSHCDRTSWNAGTNRLLLPKNNLLVEFVTRRIYRVSTFIITDK